MADQRFKVENGIVVHGGNNIFKEQVTVSANLYVNGSMLWVGQDLFVTGNLVYTNTQVAGDLIPYDDKANLGNTSNRFDLFAYDVQVDGSIVPGSNGVILGNTTKRFDVYATSINDSGTLTVAGNTFINSSAFVVVSNTSYAGVGVGTSSPYTDSKLTVVGQATVNGNVSVVNGGNLTVNGSITAQNGATVNGNISTDGTFTFGKVRLATTRTTVSDTSANIIDQFPKANSKFAKLLITVDNSTGSPSVVHTVEMLLAHDANNNVIATKYAELYNSKMGSFDASVSGSNVIVTFTASEANTHTVTALRQQVLD